MQLMGGSRNPCPHPLPCVVIFGSFKKMDKIKGQILKKLRVIGKLHGREEDNIFV